MSASGVWGLPREAKTRRRGLVNTEQRVFRPFCADAKSQSRNSAVPTPNLPHPSNSSPSAKQIQCCPPTDLSPYVPRIHAGSFFVLSCILTSQRPQLTTIARFGIGYKEKPETAFAFSNAMQPPTCQVYYQRHLRKVPKAHSFFSGMTLSGNWAPSCSSPPTMGTGTIIPKPRLRLSIFGASSGRANSNCLMRVTRNVCNSMTLRELPEP